MELNKLISRLLKISDQFVINDGRNFVIILPPKDFNFDECLKFLARSQKEVLHEVRGNAFFKLIKLSNELVLLKVMNENGVIRIDFPEHKLEQNSKLTAALYIWNLFDLGRDLDNFYELGEKDNIVKPILNKYFGLRVIGIPDLFEALCWAIMGQQINLTFAYSLKRKLVEKYGECFQSKDNLYWLFPDPTVIAKLEVSDLTSMQFTSRKAEYVIGVAKLIADGTLSKEKLLKCKDYEERLNMLLKIRGVGNWIADYVLMKCLMELSAFPIADVGIHNALKIQLGLDKKPSIEEIKNLATKWQGWEAYVTFYLWRSLYE